MAANGDNFLPAAAAAAAATAALYAQRHAEQQQRFADAVSAAAAAEMAFEQQQQQQQQVQEQHFAAAAAASHAPSTKHSSPSSSGGGAAHAGNAASSAHTSTPKSRIEARVQRHRDAERRHREKLQSNLEELASLVPYVDETEQKAVVYAKASAYIHYLRSLVDPSLWVPSPQVLAGNANGSGSGVSGGSGKPPTPHSQERSGMRSRELSASPAMSHGGGGNSAGSSLPAGKRRRDGATLTPEPAKQETNPARSSGKLNLPPVEVWQPAAGGASTSATTADASSQHAFSMASRTGTPLVGSMSTASASTRHVPVARHAGGATNGALPFPGLHGAAAMPALSMPDADSGAYFMPPDGVLPDGSMYVPPGMQAAGAHMRFGSAPGAGMGSPLARGHPAMGMPMSYTGGGSGAYSMPLLSGSHAYTNATHAGVLLGNSAQQQHQQREMEYAHAIMNSVYDFQSAGAGGGGGGGVSSMTDMGMHVGQPFSPSVGFNQMDMRLGYGHMLSAPNAAAYRHPSMGSSGRMMEMAAGVGVAPGFPVTGAAAHSPGLPPLWAFAQPYGSHALASDASLAVPAHHGSMMAGGAPPTSWHDSTVGGGGYALAKMPPSSAADALPSSTAYDASAQVVTKNMGGTPTGNTSTPETATEQACDGSQ